MHNPDGPVDAPPEVATVAATQRIMSRWMRTDTERRMLLEAASNTETYWDATTCPVCEQPDIHSGTGCDPDCPLEAVRAALP